jgi:hypothetical protein
MIVELLVWLAIVSVIVAGYSIYVSDSEDA